MHSYKPLCLSDGQALVSGSISDDHRSKEAPNSNVLHYQWEETRISLLTLSLSLLLPVLLLAHSKLTPQKWALIKMLVGCRFLLLFLLVVYRFTNLPNDHNYDEGSARKILFASGRLLPVKGSLIALILTWRRNSHLRPRQRHRLAFMTPFCYWLLLFSGAKFPCGICHHPVRENQAGVQCDLCNYWVHKRCMSMPNYEYEQLQLSDEPWCCPPCLKEALPFHNCSTISSCNSFSSLPPPPSPHNDGSDLAVSPNPCKLSLLYSNCRSLVPKLDNLRVQANSLNPCIIALTETWLDGNISDNELCIPGYSVIRCDRNRHGGGVLLYIRSDLPIILTSPHHSLELLLVDIRLRQGNMLIGLFYRPPSAPVSIIDDLDTALSDIHPTRLRSTVLLGDFNINLMSATPHTNPCFLPMRDLPGKFNFTQVVTEPTRCTNVSSSIIDHVYLSEASLLQSCLTLPPLGSSDHNCLLVKLNWSIPPPVKYKRTIWFTKELTLTLFPRSLKPLTVTLPSLTSTISGQTGKTASLIS